MKKKFLSLTLCLTLTLSAFGALSPAYAANVSSTAYTFGDANGPWPDLYAEHQKEVKQREKERRKAEKERKKAEKAAKKKAAKAAKEREKRENAAKKSAEQKG